MNGAQGERVAIYARVSTTDQTAQNQLRALREVAVNCGYILHDEYVDEGFSGTNDKRPEWRRLMVDARRHKFAMVLTWALDRVGRNVRDLTNISEEFRRLKVDLYFHQQDIDTSTATGRLFFHMLGALAEYESALRSERIKAGIARARETGTRSGRPIGQQKIGDEKEQAIREMLRDGIGKRRTAKELKVGVSTVMRVAKEME